jgi:protein-S-isoprenylcysteine O-methyltransferase Ste14
MVLDGEVTVLSNEPSDELNERPPAEEASASEPLRGAAPAAAVSQSGWLVRITWWLERVIFPAIFGYLLIRYVWQRPLPEGGSGPWTEYLLNLVRLLVVPLFLLTARRAERTRLTWRGALGVVLALGAPFFFQADLEIGHWYYRWQRVGSYSVSNSVLFFSVSLIYSCMLIAAYLNLGRNLSVTPVLREVVSVGLYAHVRHPVYSGALHLAAITVTVFASWNNAVCLLLLNVGAYLRLIEEEAIMSEAQSYRDYMARVKPRVYTALVSSPLVFLVLLRLLT